MELLVVGAVVAGAAIYLARHVARMLRGRGGGCGCGADGDCPKRGEAGRT